jgi:nucleotide-binding universal stress UspA family protein
MKCKQILVPLDLLRGTPDVLVYVQNLAMESPLFVTLLHVVDVNVSPIRPGLYDELCAEAAAGLRKLAKLFFGAEQAVRVVVRTGNVSDEIVGEAKAAAADLIVLCARKAPRRLRIFGRRITRQVLNRAPCPTIVLPASRKAISALEGHQPMPAKAPRLQMA